jgi:hypothetical protein
LKKKLQMLSACVIVNGHSSSIKQINRYMIAQSWWPHVKSTETPNNTVLHQKKKEHQNFTNLYDVAWNIALCIFFQVMSYFVKCCLCTTKLPSILHMLTSGLYTCYIGHHPAGASS